VVVWDLNGTTLSSVGTIGSIDFSFHVVATGDFFQNGGTDVLWESTRGTFQAWSLNGSSLNGYAAFGQMGAEWHIAGIAHFAGIGNGNSNSDIVWVNTKNDVQIWQMTGGKIAQIVTPSGRDGPEWTLQGVGDFASTGQSQLLWLDGGGHAQLWSVTGSQVSVTSSTAPLITAPPVIFG
jgi:hypothetical protein